MSGRRFDTIDDYERHLAAGYGQGEGMSFKPWLTVRDVPAPGRTHKIFSTLCGREHQLLSDFAAEYFLITLYSAAATLESPGVVDIRETYVVPLVDSLTIAQALGLQHPKNSATKLPDVLWTSFLITTRDATGTLALHPRSAIASIHAKTSGWRALMVRLEIIRVFWAEKGLTWKLITRNEVNQQLYDNLRNFYEAAAMTEIVNDLVGQELLIADARNFDWTVKPVNENLRGASERIGRTFEHTVSLFKFLAWSKVIVWSIHTHRFHPSEPLPAQPVIAEKLPTGSHS